MKNLLLLDRTTELRKVANVLRAVNHPLRKTIVRILDEKKDFNVTDLYVTLRIPQSVVSQHLRILREAKIIEVEKIGKEMLYRPNYITLNRLEKIVGEILTEIVPV